jgi:beta-galactosidase
MPLKLSRRDTVKGLAALASSSVLPRITFAGLKSPTSASHSVNAQRERRFDDSWRFRSGDYSGAENPSFNDLGWRRIDLPHDWSIEDLPSHPESTGEAAVWEDCGCPAEVGPFSRLRSEGKGATGWVLGGVGWYRKSFATPKLVEDGRVELLFDGVYMNADVWINGHHLGHHPYGYTGFAYDITSHLQERENVVAVRVNNNGKNSRWYSGSGIYRHVWLTVTGNLYVPLWGVHVAAAEVSRDSANLSVSVRVANQGQTSRDVRIQLRILDPNGSVSKYSEAKQQVPLEGEVEVQLNTIVDRPKLWSPATPYMYSAEVEVLFENRTVDQISTNFGIRKIAVDAVQGLRINDEPLKLRGGCLHHDNGVLGSVAIDRAEERRVELMKANGFNAIRCSHNPPSPAFLAACDRLGVLVIDEAFDMWETAKNPEDYHLNFKEWWQPDLDAMVLRDRNHPSVVFWSIGNEVPERADPAGVVIAKRLIERVRKLDSTRPITMAVPFFFEFLSGSGKPRPWSDTDAAFQYLDVCGYNYEWRKYESDHARQPMRVMVGTESLPIQASEIWEIVNKCPFVLGDFVWTGMDYLGEAGIGAARLTPRPNPMAPPPALPEIPAGLDLPFPPDTSFVKTDFPWFNAYCGDFDLIGNKKPQSYFRDVVWGRSKLEMAVQRALPDGRKEQVTAWGWFDELRSWTWPGEEDLLVTVRVYSTGDQVRLLLNGKEVGNAGVSTKTKLTAEFSVPYAPGELKAIALKDGNPIAELNFKTTGTPYRITLLPDRSELKRDRNDLSYVMVHIEDKEGNEAPDAVAEVIFDVVGAGELAAVGNANPKEMASFRRPRRRTFHGKCLAIVRPTGTRGLITVQARSEGLLPASTEIRVA